MKAISFDGTIVNLDKYEKVEAKQALGMLGQLIELQKYVVVAIVTKPGLLGSSAEKAVLGVYNTENRAEEVKNMLVKAWCSNNETFSMPIN